MYHVGSYEVRKSQSVPSPFDEMYARTYQSTKHSLAAAMVHFWPGGSCSSRLSHIFMLFRTFYI